MVKLDKTHHMGKSTGYDLRNGEYRIAPEYVEQFDKIRIRRRGIEMMLEVVTEHATTGFEEVALAQRKIWDALEEDFGVPFSKGRWTYKDGVIHPVPEPTESKGK